MPRSRRWRARRGGGSCASTASGRSSRSGRRCSPWRSWAVAAATRSRGRGVPSAGVRASGNDRAGPTTHVGMPATVVKFPATDLRMSAENVLRGNDNGGYTVPSRATYPHQWNWDSALAALGWVELDPARAWRELETLASARDQQGMIPHIAFHTRVPDRVNGRLRGALTTVARPYARYLPGPRWWGRRLAVDGRRISGITQPPVAATCMRILFESRPDEARARALLTPLLGWHRFLLEERDPRGSGEPVLIHPWESGRENAVEWDAPLWRGVAGGAVLVRRGTRVEWAQSRLARGGAFRVLDPGFSAILARACADLGWLAEELGEGRIAEESRAASARVADALRARADADGLIRALDMTDETTLEVTSAGSALALLAPGLGPSNWG